MSDLEDELWSQLENAGISPPEYEYRFAKAIGRQWRFDAAFPEHLVAIEVEGGAWVNGRHNRGSGFEADLLKYATATAMGWRVIRVGSKLIKSGEATELIKQLLEKVAEAHGRG